MNEPTMGQRGKSAEKVVESILRGWNSKANFAYWRLPDSRSARSYLAAQPGDFVYFADPYAGIIEVKETLHAVRIAKDKISQLIPTFFLTSEIYFLKFRKPRSEGTNPEDSPSI
jgi:hypothetical protein